MAARLRRLVHVDTRYFELYSAGVLGLVWGIFLIWPASTFASNVAYRPMAELATEMTWGTTLMLLGLFQSGALVAESFDRKISRRLRFWACLFAAGAFGFIATMYWQSNPLGVAWGTYGLISLMNLWAAVVYLGRP